MRSRRRFSSRCNCIFVICNRWKTANVTRSACLAFLRRWLVYFYPGKTDLVEKARDLAAQLGGHLETPRLSWKYAWIQKLCGWTTAKRVQLELNKLKFYLLRSLDETLVRFDTAGDALPASLPVVPRFSRSDQANDWHFRTDHLRADLRNRTLTGGFITLTAQGIQFALNLASIVILARLLSPRDFGLVAMGLTIVGFLRVFKEAGLSTATVQREGITHAQVSNLFWINVVVSGLISLTLAAAAPVVAWFYHEPRLVGITLALSLTFVLAGSAVQHMALLNRQMRFKAISLIQVGSVLAGVLVGVGMAWLEYGYWSLVGMNLTTSMVALLMTWAASRWRPQAFTRGSGTRSLLNFGANLSAGTFFYSFARGLDSILIGRFCGAVSVGLYSRAAALINRPLEQLIYPLEAVFLPAFSRLLSQPDRYRLFFLEVYEAIALTSFFYTGMCFALADTLTLVVLGPKWEKASILFACFTFAALQFPLATFANWLLASQGRGRDSLLANSIISVIMAGSFVAGLPFGPTGVAMSYSVSCLLVQMPILYYLVGRSGSVSTGDLWMGFLRQLPLWPIAFFATWLARRPLPDGHPIKELLIAAPSGLVAGAAFILVYPPARRVAVNLLSTLRRLKNPA